MLRENNEILNIYKVVIVIGFKIGLMNITLNELEPEKTQCFFEIMNAVGGVAQPATLNSLQDIFLHHLVIYLQANLRRQRVN